MLTNSTPGSPAPLNNQNGKTKFSLFLAMTTVALVERAFGPLVPFIRDGFGLSEMQVAFAGGAVLLGSLLGAIPLGYLLERVRAELAIPINLVILGVACGILALQTTFLGLAFGLLVLGIIRSGIVPAVNKAIAYRFPRLQRGGVMGLVSVGGPLGGVIAGSFLPPLARSIGWESSFFLLATAAFISAVIPSISRKPSKISAGVSRTQHVSLDTTFWRLVLATGLIYSFMASGIYAASAFLTLYLVDSIKVNPVIAGLCFGLAQAGSAGGRVLWGKLADGPYKYSRHKLLSLIAFVSTLSFIMLIILSPDSPQLCLVTVMILFGATTLASWGVLFTILPDIFGENATSTATAIILCIAWASGVIGPILFGFMLNRFQSYNFSLGLFAGFSLVAAGLFSLVPSVRSRST